MTSYILTKRLETKFWKYYWQGDEVTTPQFTSASQVSSGEIDGITFNDTNYYVITNTSTGTKGTKTDLLIYLGDNCLSIKEFCYNSWVVAGIAPGLGCSNVRCSIDGITWDTIYSGKLGSRGTTPSTKYSITSGNNYKYFKTNLYSDDGNYGYGYMNQFSITYIRNTRYSRESTIDDYDYMTTVNSNYGLYDNSKKSYGIFGEN